ncbi:MAG: hypothetical protein ACRBBQ_16410 [Cognatishimia sp.]
MKKIIAALALCVATSSAANAQGPVPSLPFLAGTGLTTSTLIAGIIASTVLITVIVDEDSSTTTTGS